VEKEEEEERCILGTAVRLLSVGAKALPQRVFAKHHPKSRITEVLFEGVRGSFGLTPSPPHAP